MDFFFIFFLLLLGLSLGSFCTVCIYRLPQNLNVIFPRSQCTFCKKKIQWFYNIPLLSFFFLKGISFCCKKKISLIYPLTEFLSVFSILYLYFYFGEIQKEFIFLYFFILGLIILFFTDFKFFLLPNTVVFSLYFLGLLRCFLIENSPFFPSKIDCLIGFVAGIIFLYTFAYLYKLFRKKDGMGMGDIKLIGALGLWFGWQSLFFIIIVSSLLGVLFGISAVILGKMQIQTRIPYGCFLVLAAFLYMAFISSITSFYQTYMFV